MTIGVVVYHTYLDRLYFSLTNDICFISINWKSKNISFKNSFFHLHFFNNNILINILVINM